MYFCYVDEAGCTGAIPHPHSSIQPIFVICGIIIEQKHVGPLTHDFLFLKKKFFPNKYANTLHLDCVKEEIKGADLRKLLRKGRNQQRFVLGFLDKAIELMETYHVSITGRIWIKPIGDPFDGRAVYTSSIQNIASVFQNYLKNRGEEGIIIADSRNKKKNAVVSHSIFTQKYKPSGDSYNLILEMPVYGHSDNHVCIQLADLLTSAILFPVATSVYCSGHLANQTHLHANYLQIRNNFGERLSRLQYRYQDLWFNWYGGIKVSDPMGHQNAVVLFH